MNLLMAPALGSISVLGEQIGSRRSPLPRLHLLATCRRLATASSQNGT